MNPLYPTLLRRYLSTIIDGILIVASFLIIPSILYQDAELARIARIIILLSMLLIYEPLCTSKLCTIGQLITGIRIRRRKDYRKISIFSAYIRIIVKSLLGLISFFTIPVTREKRAIHDFAVNSVVILHQKS